MKDKQCEGVCIQWMFTEELTHRAFPDSYPCFRDGWWNGSSNKWVSWRQTPSTTVWNPCSKTEKDCLVSLTHIHTLSHLCSLKLVSLINSPGAWQGAVQPQVRRANSGQCWPRHYWWPAVPAQERLTDREELRSKPHLSDGVGGETRWRKRREGNVLGCKTYELLQEIRKRFDAINDSISSQITSFMQLFKLALKKKKKK